MDPERTEETERPLPDGEYHVNQIRTHRVHRRERKACLAACPEQDRDRYESARTWRVKRGVLNGPIF